VTFVAASSLRVTDPKQAQVLADPHSLKFLTPFVGRERTASVAANELGVSLQRMLYWVKRLLALGLIAQTQQRRQTRHYRAVADTFFVPFNATDAETGEQLLERWNRPWHDIFVGNFLRELAGAAPEFGVRLERDGEDVHVALASTQERDFNFFDPNLPSVLDGWVTNLYLDPRDAKAMLLEVLGVYLKYRNRTGAQRYIARASFAPMQETQAPFADRPFSSRTKGQQQQRSPVKSARR
jgi:hypothetical protein